MTWTTVTTPSIERTEAIISAGNSRLARITYRGLWLLARALLRVWFRLTVVGRDRIPDSGAFVLAPVHRSNLDFLLAGLTTPRRLRWMAKESIFLGGLVDRFLVAMGAFPVHRDTVDREALRTARTVLARGGPVVMFPEGRRKDGPVVEDLFDGPAYVACRERVPVVPVGIGGSDRAMPIGSKFVFPRKVVIVVGEPIYPDVELEGRVAREKINELTAQVGVELQRLYDEARARVG